MSENTQRTTSGESTRATRGTVFLVDDDKFLLDMYSMKFVQQGFTVQAFLSADQALASLRDGLSPEVILFDINMPERDGFSFLQALAEEKLGTRSTKIALTNQSSDQEREKAKSMGADDYLVKATLIPSEVVNKVAEYTERHAAKS